jgi:hypothetical protein
MYPERYDRAHAPERALVTVALPWFSPMRRVRAGRP